jgi:hypothetical protein
LMGGVGGGSFRACASCKKPGFNRTETDVHHPPHLVLATDAAPEGGHRDLGDVARRQQRRGAGAKPDDDAREYEGRRRARRRRQQPPRRKRQRVEQLRAPRPELVGEAAGAQRAQRGAGDDGRGEQRVVVGVEVI